MVTRLILKHLLLTIIRKWLVNIKITTEQIRNRYTLLNLKGVMKISLTQKQRAFLNAMLTSKTVEEATEKAGITKNTAYRYLKNDEWKEEYRKKRNELTETLTSQLLQLGTEAIETLEANLHDSEATPATRNTTAKTILDYIYSNYDREQIIERIEDIEDALEERGG